jgi:hypothetical protein
MLIGPMTESYGPEYASVLDGAEEWHRYAQRAYATASPVAQQIMRPALRPLPGFDEQRSAPQRVMPPRRSASHRRRRARHGRSARRSRSPGRIADDDPEPPLGGERAA